MPGIILYLTILTFLTFQVLRKPQYALVGVLCMFGLDQLGQVYSSWLRAHGSFTNLYILLLVILALPVAYHSGYFRLQFSYRQSRVRVFAVTLYLFALISVAWVDADAWPLWAKAWPYLLVNIMLAPLLISRATDLEQVQRTFIWLGGGLTLFLAMVPDWGARSLMITGAGAETGVPLALAQLSGYLLIMAVIHFRRDYLSIGWLAAVVIAALVVAIKTGSRGQLFFSLLSLTLVMPIVWRRFSIKHILQLLATVALILLLGFFIFLEVGAYSSRWEVEEMLTDYTQRYQMAMQVLGAWIDSPSAILFGLGNSASFSKELLGIYPHIVPLEVLAEEGVIGFALFVTVVAISFAQARRLKRAGELPAAVRKVYAANFGCLVFTLLLSLKQGSLLNSSEIFLFAVLGEKYFHLIANSAARQSRNNPTRASQVQVARYSSAVIGDVND